MPIKPAIKKGKKPSTVKTSHIATLKKIKIFLFIFKGARLSFPGKTKIIIKPPNKDIAITDMGTYCGSIFHKEVNPMGKRRKITHQNLRAVLSHTIFWIKRIVKKGNNPAIKTPK